jgi:hypothetical protein
MQELYDVRATLTSPPVTKFLEIEKNFESIKKGIVLDPIEFDGAEFPINAICMDHSDSLLFIGNGLNHSVTHYMNSNSLRGGVFVYKVLSDGGKPTLLPLTYVSFSTGVKALVWDAYRRCLVVGLATGVIGYYALTVTASLGSDKQEMTAYSLQLMGEMDFHDSTILVMKMIKRETKMMLIYETKDYCFMVSSSSKATLVDMSTGGIVSQLAKESKGFTSGDIDPTELIGFIGTQAGSVQLIDFSTSIPTLLSEISPNHATTNEVIVFFFNLQRYHLISNLTL